jgi:hypothetical protein
LPSVQRKLSSRKLLC